MDSRIVIKSITIKNFRSIRRGTIKAGAFNVLVGVNDAGKSNVLKALNLFFNDKVDSDSPFNYQRDFSSLFPKKSKEAKVITISVQLDIPGSFMDGGIYTWRKVWNRTGRVVDEIVNENGEKPASRSRVPDALRKIKYRYVPAVKSLDYYRTLLGDLYSSVSASLDPTLQKSIEAFSESLGSYTESITRDVFKRLELSSQLTVPTDLKEIFKALIFLTNRQGEKDSVPLTARGDGIQARHIPIILKYIAEEDQRSRNQGSTRVTTIWGFEEPENGLELANAFALADEFIEYSNSLQIFLTTHSPAFYMKKEQEGVNVFYVEKSSGDNKETKIIAENSTAKIADEMGLMPLVAPFIAEQAKKLEIAQEIYNKNFLTDVPTILVEGETDVEYLRLAIKHLSPRLQEMLITQELRIVYKLDGAGTSQLYDWALSWIYSGFRSRMYILLDKDEAGINTRNDIINGEAYKCRKQSISMKVSYISPSEPIIELYNKHIKFQYEIEHLFSVDVWKTWKEMELVTPRSDSEVRNMFDGLIPRDKTLDNVVDELVQNIDIRDTIVMFEPKELKKKRMASVLKENFSENAEVFSGFARTIADIESVFCG